MQVHFTGKWYIENKLVSKELQKSCPLFTDSNYCTGNMNITREYIIGWYLQFWEVRHIQNDRMS